MSNKNEALFKKHIKSRLKKIFPGILIFQTDPTYCQGVPDILVLYNDRWAALEFKKNQTASHRPNQNYYIDKMNEMSYASFIYPENEEEVLNGLERTLGSTR